MSSLVFSYKDKILLCWLSKNKPLKNQNIIDMRDSLKIQIDHTFVNIVKHIPTFGSNESLFFLRSSSTLFLISGEMFLASNVCISSFTPRLAKKLNLLKHKKLWIAQIYVKYYYNPLQPTGSYDQVCHLWEHCFRQLKIKVWQKQLLNFPHTRCLCQYNVTGWDRSHGLPDLSHVWQHVKMSDVNLGTRPQYSLVADEDVKKPTNQPTSPYTMTEVEYSCLLWLTMHLQLLALMVTN